MQQKQELIDYFKTLNKHSSLGVSYAFIGQDYSLVDDVVKLINCQQSEAFCDNCWDCKSIKRGNHPDLLIIESSGLTIGIELIREAVRFLALKPYRLKRKTIIIKQAQNLTPQASNAFLKTLEEAPPNSFIALCTSKIEGLLPTIISRCRKIFLPFEDRPLQFDQNQAVIGFLKGQSVYFESRDRKKFSDFLWSLIVFIHSGLLAQNGALNNQLSNSGDCAIILNSYSPLHLQAILADLLKIYSAHKSVNMNLALNLIRTKLK